MRSTSPAIQPRPSVTSYSRPRSARSCMPTQMPKNGRPLRRTASSSASTMPATAVEPAPAIGKGADARQHHAIGARHHGRIVGHDDRLIQPGFMRRALERFGGRVQIAGAVIDDSDAHRCAPGSGNRPTMPDVAALPGAAGCAGGGGGEGFGAAPLRGEALPSQTSKKRRSASSRSSPLTMPTFLQPRRRKRSAAACRPRTRPAARSERRRRR